MSGKVTEPPFVRDNVCPTIDRSCVSVFAITAPSTYAFTDSADATLVALAPVIVSESIKVN